MKAKFFKQQYPNLDAILNGTVSGQVTEWPAIRGELQSLIDHYESQIELMQYDLMYEV